MEIKELQQRPNMDQTKGINDSYTQFGKLIAELRTKELPTEIVKFINTRIDQINSISESDQELRKLIRKTQTSILRLVEKELKLITINHYRNTWLAVGMAAFGIPFGVVLGASLGNMAFLGVGLPIGMVIGIAVGTSMDKKALEEGRQLELEIKY